MKRVFLGLCLAFLFLTLTGCFGAKNPVGDTLTSDQCDQLLDVISSEQTGAGSWNIYMTFLGSSSSQDKRLIQSQIPTDAVKQILNNLATKGFGRSSESWTGPDGGGWYSTTVSINDNLQVQVKIRYFKKSRRLEFIEVIYSNANLKLEGYVIFNQDPLTVVDEIDIHPVNGSYALTIEMQDTNNIYKTTTKLVFDGMTIVHLPPEKAIIPAILVGHIKGYYSCWIQISGSTTTSIKDKLMFEVDSSVLDPETAPVLQLTGKFDADGNPATDGYTQTTKTINLYMIE